MNHHDIRLIEIGQKEGYAKAVREIVAWLRKDDFILTAEELEKKFGGDNGQRNED